MNWIYFLLFACSILCFTSDDYCRHRMGEIPTFDPGYTKKGFTFMPYNPVVMSIDMDIEKVLSLAYLREKGKFICLTHSGIFEKKSQNLDSYQNVDLLSSKTDVEGTIKKYCRKSGLNKVDMLILGGTRDKCELIKSLDFLVGKAIVLYVSTFNQSIKEICSLTDSYGYTLISFGEDKQSNGQAFLVKSEYFNGAYRRKLI